MFLLLGLAVVIAVFLVALYPMVMVGAPKTATIKIPRDATEQTVRDSLTKYFGESYASKVMRMIALRRADVSKRYGAYEIPEGTNALGAMRRLTSMAQTPVRITINGFRSLPLLVEKVSAKMDFPEDSLWSQLRDPEVMGAYGLTPESAMALFLDDTYEVYWNQPASQLVRKIGENYRFLWSEGRQRKAAEMGVTPEQMMVVASITDEETNDAGEKGTIGRLYINRINKGMKLQADPTVRFAIGDFTIRRVSRNDLKYESPYNTYIVKGTPPGPIRTTSARTVQSILDEPAHEYLYMCAKDDFSGSHNFATDYDEHTRNALKYQASLDSRGIRR